MLNVLQSARKSRGLRWLLDNPLFTREVRRRMRSKVFSLSLVFYIILLGVITCLIMVPSYPMTYEVTPTRQLIQNIGAIGGNIFTGMIWLEVLLAVLIAPLLTSGVATAEKDRNTFDFLRVTTLSAGTFVTGCLLTTASLLLLVFSCTLPILGLTFIFGGVSMKEILTANLLIFCLGMALSSVGVFHSSGAGRSRGMRIVSVVILIIFAFWLLVGLSQALIYRRFAAIGGFGSGDTWHPTLVISGCFLGGMLVFSIAAARRLYEPNNRLFNYKQYTAFFVLLVGAMGGMFTYVMSPLYEGDKPEGIEVDHVLVIYYFTGLFLVALGMLLFLTGRLERGDELWRMRIRHRVFQRFDERLPLFVFYLVLWLGPMAYLVWRWDDDLSIRQHLINSLPITLLMLAVIYSLCRFVSLFTPMRNRAAITVVLLLLVFWGLLPAMGLLFQEVSPNFGIQMGVRFEWLSGYMIDLSPFPALHAEWDGDALKHQPRNLYLMGGLALLLLLPTLAPGAQKRFRVSYELKPTDFEALKNESILGVAK